MSAIHKQTGSNRAQFPRSNRAERLCRRFGALLIASAVLTLSGCGYSTKPLYNRSVNTVAVPIFTNKTFRREWEYRLTEAIDKDIEGMTPYKVVGKSHADTILTGEIVDIREDVLTHQYGLNLPQETQITIIVNFQWKDLRSGKVLMERKEFNRSSTELPQVNVQVADAEQAAVEELARGIVDQMQRDW